MQLFSEMKIGVLMGGKSREREISLRSGQAVLAALQSSGLNAVGIDLTGNFTDRLKHSGIDFAFIALHGKGGEDGEIQAVLEFLEIPYLGTGPAGSRNAFDKISSKKIFRESGIPTPEFCVLTRKEDIAKALHLHLPVFLKPVDEGSSIDVKLVYTEEGFESAALELLAKYKRILAEEGIAGREMTVGVLGDTPLPVIEVRPKNAFYDYEAKYTPGMTEYLVPAPVTDAESSMMRTLALKVHNALALRDFSRVDIILSKVGPYVLEANTIPGFTATSLLPKAANLAGYDFPALCRELVRIALARTQKNEEEEKQKIFMA